MWCSSEPAARCPQVLTTEATRGVLDRLADRLLDRLQLARPSTAVGIVWLDEVTTGRRWPISDARPAQAMRIPSLPPMTDLGCGSAGAESIKMIFIFFRWPHLSERERAIASSERAASDDKRYQRAVNEQRMQATLDRWGMGGKGAGKGS